MLLCYWSEQENGLEQQQQENGLKKNEDSLKYIFD